MEMQKEAEEKQQQKMLESEELFDNIHAHLGPHVDAIEPLLIEVIHNLY